MSEADSARPTPLRGRNGPSECSSRGPIGWPSFDRSSPSPASVSSSVEVCRISRCVGVVAASRRALMSASASAMSLPGRALQQRRQLEQLQVAHDAVGDVQFGVQAQLAQAPADARDALEHLFAHQLEGRLQAVVRRRAAVRAASAFAPSALTPPARRPRAHHRARGQVARQLARRRLGCGAHELGGELAQALQARLLLGGVLGRQQRAPARAEQLDQLDDERVGRERLERAGGAAVKRGEALDSFARLGRHLRRLGGGGQAGDQVELAPARQPG